MKLDKDTFNPKLHKVTLQGKPVEIVGFGIGEYEKYAFSTTGMAHISLLEVTEIKRFRVGLFTYGVGAVTMENWPYEDDTNFIKWLTNWTEYNV